MLGRADLLTVFLRSDDEIRDEAADDVLGRMRLVDPSRVAVEIDGTWRSPARRDQGWRDGAATR